MVKTSAVAISPDKSHLVVKRGDDHYAVIDRRKGITKSTKWRDKSALSQMLIKGGYKKFKEPVEYRNPADKIEKGRKSVARMDEDGTTTKDVKKTKQQQLVVDLGLEAFVNDVLVTRTVRKASELVIDLEKADNKHLPKGSERFAYKTPTNYEVIFIPVNRLKQVYQTDEAINPSKVNENARKMKEGIPLDPVEIGYNYDVHDGHHRWEAAKKLCHTHVPCKVVGQDPEKVKQAKEEYKSVWKSVEPSDLVDLSQGSLEDSIKGLDREGNSINKSSLDLALVVDLSKALNYSKLIKKRVAVKGKNGKVFHRMQWVLPSQVTPDMQSSGDRDEYTFAHHEDGLKDLERRQSNRFPVLYHPVDGLSNTDHNYRTDKAAYAEAERKYKAGEKLPPVKINPRGEILEGHHLVDLANKHDLNNVPVIVVGNPTLKKELEDKLKGKDVEEDQKEDKAPKGETEEASEDSNSSEMVTELAQFTKFTSKKYTKQHLMSEAKRQGLTWKTEMNNGTPLPENSAILWMHAQQAITKHIKDGNTFEVKHISKDVDKRMNQDGKDSIHKHFLTLLEKHGPGKDDFMEWVKDNGIMWKENKDPSINWMRCVKEVKQELAKGKMVGGVRTRQKEAMKEANTNVTDQIKDMVTEMGKRYGKLTVYEKALKSGININAITAKGIPLPPNSSILWMRTSVAIAKHLAQGGTFSMSDSDEGIVSRVGDHGDTNFTSHQRFALDRGKRNSRNKETKMKKWAMEALMVDRGITAEEAEELYTQFMEKAREKKILIHFDPLEMLPGGTTLAEQFSSDGLALNDYLLNRGLDREHREANEGDMFGDEYNDANDSARPNYGVIDMFGQGLGSHPYNGEVAMVMKDDIKKRTTGSATDSNNIPYGEEGNTVRSMEDPHHLIIDRWQSRWKKVNKKDSQRARMFDAVLDGVSNHDDKAFFETHVHGGVDLNRDIEHFLVPQSWKSDGQHKEKHEQIKNLAKQFGVPINYE